MKLVCGVGINDVDYVTQVKETIGWSTKGSQIQSVVWTCPYYERWKSMIARCYSGSMYSYRDCYVCNEWLYLSNFKAWMETQDWQGKELDKDLLCLGNKIYSPDNCIFIDKRINMFLIENKKNRGKYPTGVSYAKKSPRMKNELSKPYVARIKVGSTRINLGRFSTPEEAHKAWIVAKLKAAKELAAEILADGGDPRVAKALVDRYENYVDTL